MDSKHPMCRKTLVPEPKPIRHQASKTLNPPLPLFPFVALTLPTSKYPNPDRIVMTRNSLNPKSEILRNTQTLNPRPYINAQIGNPN